MHEYKNLEYKESITNSFLKTVSAYANFGTGKIIFGINNDGIVVGLDNCEQVRLDLENKINDSISPRPDFTFEIDSRKKTLTLTVFEGDSKPYLYHGKAYRRADTASIEVDTLELRRLVLAGEHKEYEQLAASNQDLTFADLSSRLKENLHIASVNLDVLKTLALYNEQTGYNKAAEILADNNNCPGIDIARFGAGDDEIMERITLSGKAVLSQYDKTMQAFSRYYISEIIRGDQRSRNEKIPYIAFKEAVANAIIHRTWDVNAAIRIAMYPDRVVIYSPGGLPSSVSVEEYLEGRISVLRNPALANVFFRLGYVEIFGTGIRRIKTAYHGLMLEPAFEISDNAIKVVLPSISALQPMTSEEKSMLELFPKDQIVTAMQIMEFCGYSRKKVLRILSGLIDKGYVRKQGNGRSVKYRADI